MPCRLFGILEDNLLLTYSVNLFPASGIKKTELLNVNNVISGHLEMNQIISSQFAIS